jgi:hypothetical protein
LVTAAALDETQKYCVTEVYEALMEANTWGLLVGLAGSPLSIFI